MEAWIPLLGLVCCGYTVFELVRVSFRPGLRPAEPQAATRRAAAASGAAAADARTGRPLTLRRDRRLSGRRRGDASGLGAAPCGPAREAGWPGAC